MRLHVLITAFAVLGGGCSACGRGDCPAPEVHLPSSSQTVAWEDGGYAVVRGEMDDHPVSLLLNTGSSQSAVVPPSLDAGFDFNVARLRVEIGGATAEDVYAGILIQRAQPIDGLVGADLLHQIPLSFDARARTTTFFPRFDPPSADTEYVDVVTSDECVSRVIDGAKGPFALLVRGEVEGAPMQWEIDTGAEASFIRQELFDRLTGRARLPDLFVRSGFVGLFGTATRAREIKAGRVGSPNALVIAAPEIDALLNERTKLFTRQETSGRTLKVDGILGWSFLREFNVSLTTGESVTRNRGIGLVRFDTQSHWTREFVGIGIYRAASSNPTGIRVLDFLAGSPAKQAGIEANDVIVKVDGVPVGGDDPITSTGAVVEIEVLRRSDTGVPLPDGGTEPPDGGFVLADGGVMVPLNFQVGYVDLLPDPP
jgi:PDZ domain